MDNLNLTTTPYLNENNLYTTIYPSKEKVSPSVISIVSSLLGLQIIGTIFFLIVIGISKKRVYTSEGENIGLIFYLTISILETIILITSIVLIYKYKNNLNNTEINIIFWSLLGYVILQLINIILNSTTNYKAYIDNSIKKLQLNKIDFDISTSIYVFRGIGTFLSVHIFIHLLFLSKVEVQSKIFKKVLDILIPLLILLIFRVIERLITKREINKEFFKELFFGKWKIEKKNNNNNIQLTKIKQLNKTTPTIQINNNTNKSINNTNNSNKKTTPTIQKNNKTTIQTKNNNTNIKHQTIKKQ